MHTLLKHTLENIKSNFKLNLSAIAVIALLFLVFNLLLFSNSVAGQIITQMKSRMTFSVYLKYDTDFFTIRRLLETLEKRSDVAPPAVYISQEEAQKSFAESMGLDSQFFKKTDLRLPSSINITPKKPNDEKNIRKFLEQGPFSQYLMKTPQSELMRESKTFETVSKNLGKLQNLVNSLIGILTGFMILSGILTIFITLKLTADARKKELFIMKLVGASPHMLEFPYLIEGIIIAAAGSAVGILLTMLIPPLFFEDQFLLEAYKNFRLANVFVLELMAAVPIGFTGSSFMVHKLQFSKKMLRFTL